MKLDNFEPITMSNYAEDQNRSSKGTAYREKRCTSSIYYRKLHPLGNQRLMPVQINEQKLTIYNATICTSAQMITISMWASSCCFATLSLKTLISCCVTRLYTSDSSPISIIASAINWFTNIHLFRCIRDRGY